MNIKRFILFSIILLTIRLHSMESNSIYPADLGNLFGSIPNKIKRLIIFPLLQECQSIKQAEDILVSVANISKIVCEQINDIHFITDAIDLLAEKFNLGVDLIMPQLHIKGTKNFTLVNAHLFKKILGKKTGNADLKLVSKSIKLGASIHLHFGHNRTTYLIEAVKDVDVELVRYLLNKGVDINATNKYGEKASDYPLLRHPKFPCSGKIFSKTLDMQSLLKKAENKIPHKEFSILEKRTPSHVKQLK